MKKQEKDKPHCYGCIYLNQDRCETTGFKINKYWVNVCKQFAWKRTKWQGKDKK